MSKISDGTHLLSTLDAPDLDGQGCDRLTKVIQVVLAFYLLPALAIVLLFGFAMIAIGAIAQTLSRLAILLCSAFGTNRGPQPLVSGARIYRAGSGSLPKRCRPRQSLGHGGWLRRPETDALN